MRKIASVTKVQICILLAAGFLAPASSAQAPSVHKTILQDMPYPTPLHTVTVKTVVDERGRVAPHTHPGVEMAYVVSGDGRVMIAGERPHDLRSGDSFSVPPETVHELVNTGAEPLTVVSTYVVDPSRPLASAAN